MRKTLIILGTVVAMTLLIMFGYISPVTKQIKEPGILNAEFEFGDPSINHSQIIDLHAVVSADAASFANLVRMTRQFERLRPNIRIQLTNGNVDIQGNFNEADIRMIPIAAVRSEASQGNVLALDAVLPGGYLSHWFEAMYSAVQWNGFVWGIPLNWDPYIFVYAPESTVWKERAIPAAAEDWLHAASPHQAFVDPSDGYAGVLLSELMGDKDAMKEWTGETAGAKELLQAVAKGDSSWVFMRFSDAVRYGQPAGERELALHALAATPSEKGGQLLPFQGNAFVISPETKQAQEAVDWVLYITDPNVYREWMDGEEEGWPARRTMFQTQTALNGVSVVSQPRSPLGAAPLPLPQKDDVGFWRLSGPVAHFFDQLEAPERYRPKASGNPDSEN